MKITCLVENTATNNCSAEHGLSLYIEANGLNLLFDMGQSDLFAKNAEILSVNIDKIDIAILSHGHYDHGGGLSKFLKLNKSAPVYIPQNAFVAHYNGQNKYIGLDNELISNSRLKIVTTNTQIAHGLTIITHNSVPTLHKFGCFGLKKEQDGKIIDDDFDHEQYLLIEDGSKRVLISGCSHRGILNIVEAIHPDIVIGGFHTSKMELDDELKNLGNDLAKFNCRYYTCHCTGQEQFEFMQKKVEDLFYLSAGQTITL